MRMPTFWSAAIAGLGAVVGLLSTAPALSETGGTTPVSKMPDACRLVPRSDLEALFPGRRLTEKGPMLSPVYKGPQYNQSCMYIVYLPSPTSTSDQSKFVTVTVVQWGKGSAGRDGAIETFAAMRKTRQEVAANGSNRRIEALTGIGDEAFQETSAYTTDIRVRQGDLVFTLSLDNYSAQTAANAVALARQAAARWREGTGMIAGPASVQTNKAVEVPPDTRTSAQAPVDRWPDACALLPPADVLAVFADMQVSPPRKARGTLRTVSRTTKVERIPNPVQCSYEARKTVRTGDQRTVVSNQIFMRVHDMAATPELARRHYEIGRKVGDATTELTGLGDEASMSALNRIYIRKGVLNVSVSVGGDTRDRALYDEAARRVKALAEKVSARMP